MSKDECAEHKEQHMTTEQEEVNITHFCNHFSLNPFFGIYPQCHLSHGHEGDHIGMIMREVHWENKDKKEIS